MHEAERIMADKYFGDHHTGNNYSGNNHPGDKQTGNKHVDSLDGLRGLAAFAVVISHMGSLVQAFGHYDPFELKKLGGEGVALFFALSGFLMAWLYGGKPFSRAAAADYLVSRFARIYPVYLVAIGVSVALSSLFGAFYIEHLTRPVDIVRHIFLMGSTGVFWSIPPEIQFYLFFLLLWRYFSAPQRYQWLGIGIATLLALAALLNFPGPGIGLISKLPYFLFGALAGRWHALHPVAKPSIFAALCGLGLLALFMPSRILGLVTLHNFWGLSTALVAALIVYFIAWEHPLTKFIFASRPLRFLGKISFSLYLFHVPVMFLMNRVFGAVLPPPLLIALVITAVIACSFTTYTLIEAPARKLLVSAWKNREKSAPVNAAEAA